MLLIRMFYRRQTGKDHWKKTTYSVFLEGYVSPCKHCIQNSVRNKGLGSLHRSYTTVNYLYQHAENLQTGITVNAKSVRIERQKEPVIWKHLLLKCKWNKFKITVLICTIKNNLESVKWLHFTIKNNYHCNKSKLVNYGYAYVSSVSVQLLPITFEGHRCPPEHFRCL